MNCPGFHPKTGSLLIDTDGFTEAILHRGGLDEASRNKPKRDLKGMHNLRDAISFRKTSSKALFGTIHDFQRKVSAVFGTRVIAVIHVADTAD